jgi:hypothetical protein
MDYSLRIAAIVEGRQTIKQLTADVKLLRQEADRVAKLDVAGAFESPEAIRKLKEQRRISGEIVESVDKTVQLEKTSVEQTRKKLLQQIKLNSAIRLFERRQKQTFNTGVRDLKQFAGAIEEIEGAFSFFKKEEDITGIRALAEELGRINEQQRETNRQTTARQVNAGKLADFEAKIAKFKAQGLKITEAQKALDKFRTFESTNQIDLAARAEKLLTRRLRLLQEESAELNKQTAIERQRNAARMKLLRGAASSALIGGGFPLLFGQGGAAAAGGALGGLAGGLLGGPFGFALSIVGTALGDAIEKSKEFKNSLEEVNKSFSDTGNGAKLFREDIDDLARSLGVTKEEALEVAQAFAFLGSPQLTGQAGKIFGKDKGLFQAVAAIKDEATFARALEQSLNRLSVPEVERLRTELATASALERQVALTDALNRKAGKQVITSERQRRLAGRRPLFKPETTLVPAVPEAIGQADIFAGISPLMEALERMRTRSTKLNQAETGESIERSLRRQLARYEEIEPFARKTAMVNADHLITLERIAKVKDETKRTQLEELAGRVKQARLDDIEAQKIEERGREAMELLRQQKKLREEILKAQQEELKKAQQLAKGLSDTVRDGFVDGIKAATDETRTLSDALANMLNRLSDQLLNLAANLAFYGNAQGNLSQGQGLIGSLLGSIAPSLFNVTSTAGPGGYRIPDAAVPKFRANGGGVGAGRPYIVGERGPELFVPGAQGNIVPNNAMGGANVTVNVDASGSSVEGNADQASQLGKAIGIAVQQELVKQKRPGGLLAS